MGQSEGKREQKAYHHGDLQQALIRASMAQLRETGVVRFSVAQVARSLGVSTAAPYRHFADRNALIATVASVAAQELLADMQRAIADAGNDPIQQLATLAGTYVRFVASRGVGADVMYASELRNADDGSLADAGQRLMRYQMEIAEALPIPTMQEMLRVLDKLLAISHGYAILYRDGFYRDRVNDLEVVVTMAEEAVANMIQGYLAAMSD